MEITHTGILLAILIGLRGSITPNIRAVSVDYSSKHIFLFFYYNIKPTDLEEELAEEVGSEVAARYPDTALKSFKVNKIVIPYPNTIFEKGHIVYKRFEDKETLSK